MLIKADDKMYICIFKKKNVSYRVYHTDISKTEYMAKGVDDDEAVYHEPLIWFYVICNSAIICCRGPGSI